MKFTSGRPEYHTIIGSYAPSFGRLTNRAGLLDAWLDAGIEEHADSTIPNAHTRINHCLISASLTSRVFETYVDSAALGSDHWPVWTEFHDETSVAD